MSEYETNPQDGSPAQQPAHRSAAVPGDPAELRREDADPTAQLPLDAPAGPASDPGVASAAGPGGFNAPAGPGAPTGPVSAAAAGPASAVGPASGAPGGPGEPPTWRQPAVAGQPSPYPPTWQAPHGQPYQGGPHPGWRGPGPGQHGGPQHPHPHHQPQHGAMPQPPYGPQPQQGPPTQQLPPWAQSVSAAPADPARRGRGRRALATGAAALVLAVVSGGVGAAAALALHDDQPLAATRAGSAEVTRVVDRSSLAEIAAQVQDSVVSISTGSGEGSGVVLTADGFVLTNNHVVAGATGRSVRVVFADGKSADATVVGTDPRTDLAVIKADGVSGLSPATFGDSAAMQVGDTVLALGSPLGLEGSVTAGIVSAKDRIIRAGGGQEPGNPFSPQQQGVSSLAGLLQTDAPINPGNSGGALVNTNGQVIGINTAIATSGQGSGNIGVGFAIPSNKARQVADQLMKGEKVSHPYLGVSVAETENGGAVIRSVVADGPADQAGLQQGDVIRQINGKPVNDSDDVVGAVQAAKVGDRIQVTYSRNGQQRTVTATLAEAP